MDKVFIGMLFATIAIAMQPAQPPERFINGLEKRGVPIVEEDFVGAQWLCARPENKRNDETCFAGFDREYEVWITGS